MEANSSFSKSEGAPFSISYPQEWADRNRMNYLLAPFPPSEERLAENNPKFSFWSSFILSSSRELNILVITEAALQERLKWNGHTSPKCLGMVLEEMERTGQLVKLADFHRNSQETWLSWGVGLVKKPVSWAVGSYFSGSTKYTGGYVIKAMAEELAAAVMADHRSSLLYKSTDSVMTYSTFEALCLKSSSRESVSVLVQQLLAAGHLAKTPGEEQGYEVVKLSCTRDKRLTVSEVDIGIVRLKETKNLLCKQVATLEEAIIHLKTSARKKYREHDKTGALRFLRQSVSKKQVLQKKEAMLDNVQNILHNIQNAETDALVFAAYKSGVNALRSIQRPNSLEQAEDLLADLKELAENEADISAVLSEDLAGDTDEDELLKELEGITSGTDTSGKPTNLLDRSAEAGLEAAMAHLSVKEDPAQVAATLPPVPSHNPDMRRTGQPQSPAPASPKQTSRTLLQAS